MAANTRTINYEDQELMVKVLYALNKDQKMSHSDLVAALKCDPDYLELCLAFLRKNMFVISETIPGTQNIIYGISPKGTGILFMIGVWFKNVW